MAHDTYLGTFNQAQFERFLEFARSQLSLIEARQAHLAAEMTRVGVVVFTYSSNGVPTGYSADPSTSYLAKLLAAYEVLGGNPFIDLRARVKTTPVFVVAGDENVSPNLMSSGDVIAQKGLSDATTAQLMRQARSWLDETLWSRSGRLERRIRRALDYYDALQEELDHLTVIQQAVTTKGSLEEVAAQISVWINDPSYLAVLPLSAEIDAYGFQNHAPEAPYAPPVMTTPDGQSLTNPNAVGRVAGVEGTQKYSGGIAEPGQNQG
jgi:hypothetical protein